MSPKGKTTNDFIAQARKVHSDKYDYSKVNYINAHKKVCIICPVHGEFWMLPYSHLAVKGCSKCSKRHHYSTQEIIEKFKLVHGDKYDYSSVKYVKMFAKIPIICRTHGIFYQTAHDHLKGRGCRQCKLLDTNKFIDKARKIHGAKYDYSKVVYINTNTPVTIICPHHGIFTQKPTNHLAGRGCPKCGGKKMSLETFLEKATKKHGAKYDYSKVVWNGYDSKVIIHCCDCGSDFLQTPHAHLNGYGCRKCGYQRVSKKKQMSQEFFIAKCNEVHNFKYDYSKVDYKGMNTLVTIICPIHGEFRQRPVEHINGHGCSKCSNNYSLTTEEYISIALKNPLHAHLDYSKTVYLGGKKDICIICPIHGEFWQNAAAHLRGNNGIGCGCPICSKGFTSFFKLRFLTENDLSVLSSNQLLELIAMKQIPTDFKALGFTKAGSPERRDTIASLKKIYEINDEDEAQQAVSEEIHKKEIEFEQNFQKTVTDETNDDNETDETRNELVIRGIEFYDSPLINIAGEGEKFIVSESINELWNQTLRNEDNFIKMFRTRVSSGKWFDAIRNDFFREYEAVNAITPTEDYIFPYQPNLMQRLMVYRILSNDYYGNWCGTGAGKTLARDMASRAIKAKVSLYIVPNSVIDTTVNALREEYGETSQICIVKHLTDPIDCLDHKPNYIIINYEKFQQRDTDLFIEALHGTHTIDFICMDEIQNVKVRSTDNISLRNKRISRLIQEARKRNPNVKVVALSATPIINNLTEVRMLMELLTGKRYDDIGSTVSLENIHAAYKALLLNGFRYIPKYDIKINEEVLPVDGTSLIDALLKKKTKDVLGVEQILAEAKMEAVVANGKLKKGTLIFTEFVDGIVPMLQQWVEACGFSVACYTGNEIAKERNRIINSFIAGHTDILIASMPITTGVDGLQKCCDRMIIISAPWTNSEYVQLVGRIYRQGSSFAEVDIIRPEVNISVTDGEWSWDRRRFSIIETKKTLGEAVMDGDFQKVYNGEGLRQKLMAQAMEALKEGLVDGHYVRKAVEDIQDSSIAQELSAIKKYSASLKRLSPSVINEFKQTTNSLTELQIEEMLDSGTGYTEIGAFQKIRVLHRSIGERLKEIYGYRCQVTGKKLGEDYGVKAVEIHHIIPFSESLNNDSSNLIVLSPDFHRIVHRAKAKFDRKDMCFVFPNGKTVPILLDKHLRIQGEK